MTARSLGSSAKVWLPQISVPVPLATTKTELAVSRIDLVLVRAGSPSSRQPRVARTGPPAGGRRKSGITQDQRTALENRSCLARDLSGSREFGIDVAPVPDVAAFWPGRLGDVRELPERQRGRVCQPLVIVGNFG